MIYAYIRVSTDKQDGINQKKGIDEFCQKKSWIIDEYIDDERLKARAQEENKTVSRFILDNIK